jgi:hypothetical protein
LVKRLSTQAGPSGAGVGALLLSLVLAGCARVAPPGVVAPTPSGPGAGAISIRIDPQNPNAFQVVGLESGELFELAKADLNKEEWYALFSVRVAKDAPPIVGAHSITDAVVHFEPRYPLLPDVTYHVKFDPTKLPSREGRSTEPLIVSEFKLAKPQAELEGK